MSSNEDKIFSSSYLDNDTVLISSGNSITFHAEDGTDTATDRYLDIPRGVAFGFEVMPYTNAVTITKVNGRSCKAAITVGTGGYRTNNVKVTSVTVAASSDTNVEVSMKGGY